MVFWVLCIFQNQIVSNEEVGGKEVDAANLVKN